MHSIHVAIADDDPFVRAALREYLCASPDFFFAGEADDGDAALALVEGSRVDVLLLDLSMPRVSGLDVLRRISTRAPGTGVVVLSAYPATHFDGAAPWNAAVYLDKSCPPEEIVHTVRIVAAAKRQQAATELSRALP